MSEVTLDDRLANRDPNRRGSREGKIRRMRRWLCKREDIDPALADDDDLIAALLGLEAEADERRRWQSTWSEQP